MTRKTFRNVITTPEKMVKINPKNRELAESFLREKDIRSSLGTVMGYRSDLNIFFVYVMENLGNRFYMDIKKLEFAEFFNFCVTELQWGSNRFNRMRGCLSSLGTFIDKYLDEEYPMFRNHILKVIDPMPLRLVRDKTILTEVQVNTLLRFLVDDQRPQEACFVALAVSCGARASELMRFTTDIIDMSNLVYSDIFIETTNKIKTKGRSKNGVLNYKYIIKATFEKYYNAWLIEREKTMKALGKSHKFIFIKADGEPANVMTIRGWIPEWERLLGVDIYPHAFRHYTTTFLTRIGLTGELITEIMGWKSSEMYKIYNDLSSKDREWKELDKLKDYLVVHAQV